ncbi:MAG: hypothetical protein AAFR04_15335 [Pseudomonadota bacterium]
MKRVKPNPVPPVNPIWEYQAEGALLETYETYKRVLDVPWVGVVALAYARDSNFFGAWWAGLAPLAKTQAYRQACVDLRTRTEAAVAALAPPPIAGALREAGFSARERAAMREMLEVLSHGNFAQMPAVFLARLALEGRVPHGCDAAPSTVCGAPPASRAPVAMPFVLMEPHHVLGDHAALYDDIKRTIGLPFVNTDYRCLARWPRYFQHAWSDLRPHIGTDAYERAAQAVHDDIVATSLALPNVGGLDADAVCAGAREDHAGDMHPTLAVTQLFTWLLPGLMLNVAFWRAQLLDDEAGA